MTPLSSGQATKPTTPQTVSVRAPPFDSVHWPSFTHGLLEHSSMSS